MKYIATALLVLLFAASAFAAENVILFISDGWGQSTINATEYYQGQPAPYDSWDKVGMSNFMMSEGWETPPYGDGFVGLYGYDSVLAWTDWFYMQNYATDSAAAATAMSTGSKTYKGAIGVGQGGMTDATRQDLVTMVENAEALGKETGLVTSVNISHATPVGFVAHHYYRSDYGTIANEVTYESGLEVWMGCGHPMYDYNGVAWDPAPDPYADPNSSMFKYVGYGETWIDLMSGTAGNDMDNDGDFDAWTLIDEVADFQALADGTNVPNRVYGIAQNRGTLQYNRSGNTSYNNQDAPYTDPMIANVPSLELMTQGALKRLEQADNGFFLMVEGGAVDWAGHGFLLGRMIEEQVDFDNAVQAAIDWVEANSNWDETLIIVTGDHETGYLWGQGVDPSNPSTWYTPISDNGAGNLPGGWFYSTTNGHTNQIIPFYAKGAGLSTLLGYADEFEPELGLDYLDNTEVALAVFDMWDIDAGLVLTNHTTDLPAAGGTVTYDAYAMNYTDNDFANVPVKLFVTLPNGYEMNLWRTHQNFGPREQVDVDGLTLEVPANAPAGEYTITLKVGYCDCGGDVYSTSMTFTKAGVVGDATTFDPNSLIGTDLAGNSSDVVVPTAFEVEKAYPNPFNPTFTLAYNLPSNGMVKVAMFDVLGREIMNRQENQMQGRHAMTMDARALGLTSGMYFVQVAFDGQMSTQKVMLVK